MKKTKDFLEDLKETPLDLLSQPLLRAYHYLNQLENIGKIKSLHGEKYMDVNDYLKYFSEYQHKDIAERYLEKVICIVGLSGSGKSTLAKFFEESGYMELISHTTRAKRGPEDRVYSVTDEEFDKIKFVEKADNYGRKYGLALDVVNDTLQKSKNNICTFVCNLEGYYHIKNAGYKTSLIVIDVPKEILSKRNNERNVLRKEDHRTKELEIASKNADMIITQYDFTKDIVEDIIGKLHL